jgi:hypothetical protein
MKTYEIYFIDDENMVRAETFQNCENEIQALNMLLTMKTQNETPVNMILSIKRLKDIILDI